MSLLNKKIKLDGAAEPVGTGWLPPVPDLRDYTEHHEEIKAFNTKLKTGGKKLKQTSSVDKETKGALLIRNSWGKRVGENGYGWLPYEYVLNGLATDFWSLLEMGWRRGFLVCD